ncbi:DUF1353 domain-containing protein [Helicobacter sp.]|uniref:DUF1353 domain-containing protein n=1 Tax=Helicobacter sp. TaxID=218 RepID=UPI002A75130F|nr:DUF1353 domain-containing protein [Helicobacter sp.]MDY2585457.1 DUF1353 domain-containing protein [Helicobacter sp.]
MKHKDLIVKLKDFKNFELQEDFYFYFKEDIGLEGLGFPYSLDSIVHYIIVPKGFCTDFGSVPQLFQGLISPVGNASKAYVLHDFLCVLAHDGRLSRSNADRIFKEALKQVNVKPLAREILYKAVRLYAFVKGLK